MITISNLKKQYGETVACNIQEFTINSGEILGLVGNNGAGKTTLFRLMLDLIKADQGEILISTSTDINPAKSEEWKTFTGAYIDEGFLIDFLTPEEYFTFIAKTHQIDETQMNERLQEFNAFMNGEILGHKKLIRDLSAGNKQKVGIIAAMMHQPQVLILDEPFNFLDPSSQNSLKKILTNYNQQTQATILISSHNLTHTVDISSRIALLEHGNIIRDMDNNHESARQELEEYFTTNE
ncbi:ABC transporter ATP-binding protein [Prevotella sp. Rep29]|uniref:ABC transporter ATP-binding protein n=1 Tax=Prevotella sp. Rep29 TaxID=2691580 RepID=UPI001C6E2165|nr:ABC transporter ATP-binding protein [Prevotella sp. Rep29]QYR11791.1 ATP-binding cassette domain-containing protein [Prevotella sp. Rep29]